MSAYILSKSHIDVLVTLAQRGPSGVPVCPMNAWHTVRYGALDARTDYDLIGANLLAENCKSVQHRYPDCEASELPGPNDGHFMLPYRHSDPRRIPTAVEGLKLLACYEYQSCEHPGWSMSQAREFCESLRHCLISRLEGYDAADWRFDDASNSRGSGVTL